MAIDKIRKVSVKGVKLKSEGFFQYQAPGVFELWRETLGGRIPPLGPDRVKATSHSMIFNIPWHPLREDQGKCHFYREGGALEIFQVL